MRAAHLTLAVSVLALAACADDGPDATLSAAVERPAAVRVDIDRSRFSEAEVVVTAGTTVTFVNKDAFAHTVTAREDSAVSFDSGELMQGNTFEVTFEQPGEYRYLCRIHPTMRAMVVVT